MADSYGLYHLCSEERSRLDSLPVPKDSHARIPYLQAYWKGNLWRDIREPYLVSTTAVLLENWFFRSSSIPNVVEKQGNNNFPTNRNDWTVLTLRSSAHTRTLSRKRAEGRSFAEIDYIIAVSLCARI